MRLTLIIVGLVVAAIGIGAALGKFGFKQDEQVAKIGGLSADVEKNKTVPPWAGIVGVVLGAGLIVAGASRKA